MELKQEQYKICKKKKNATQKTVSWNSLYTLTVTVTQPLQSTHNTSKVFFLHSIYCTTIAHIWTFS